MRIEDMFGELDRLAHNLYRSYHYPIDCDGAMYSLDNLLNMGLSLQDIKIGLLQNYTFRDLSTYNSLNSNEFREFAWQTLERLAHVLQD